VGTGFIVSGLGSGAGHGEHGTKPWKDGNIFTRREIISFWRRDVLRGCRLFGTIRKTANIPSNTLCISLAASQRCSVIGGVLSFPCSRGPWSEWRRGLCSFPYCFISCGYPQSLQQNFGVGCAIKWVVTTTSSHVFYFTIPNHPTISLVTAGQNTTAVMLLACILEARFGNPV
jgi:hypothetical protein